MNSLFLHNPINVHTYIHPTKHSPKPLLRYPRIQCSSIEIDMVKTHQGIYAPKHDKVVVLWDLDNKPPRGPPFDAAVSLKSLAHRFGDLVDFSAYANRHAFIHLPQWVLDQRRERKTLDILERKGAITPSEPYTCGVCGRKCKTHLDLKKHFRQLHQRERQKKLNRLNSLKGMKRRRFRERFLRGDHKYNEAARRLVVPKVGYGLASELRRAGVFVKTVEDKPQAADWALKRQMVHSMSRGIDWLVLVSDDSDFSEMLRRAREANLGTVVVGDMDRALGRHADLWVPWIGVENGDIQEGDLMPKKMDRMRNEGSDEFFTNEDGEFDRNFMLVFSDDEDEDEDYEDQEDDGEIDELCDEWVPELLIPSLNEDLYYEPPVLESAAGPHTTINGNELLESYFAALEKYGVGSCGPRGFYGTIDVHLDCEARIAKFLGTPNSILYSYGLSTMFSAIPASSKKGDIIVADEGVHWGIQNGLYLSRSTVMYFKHNDMDSLRETLENITSKNKRAKKLRRYIVVEAVYQNSGQIAPLDEIIKLKEKYRFRVLMDESNSIGVLGSSGRGLTEYYGIPVEKLDIITTAMGHALATEGGFCTGNARVIDHQVWKMSYVIYNQ
ncbi:hypothetical protein RJT34_08973 [Clitoria ternatea]|uniref:C2H2-type domain-containing protein n=1 Tax=Clitoria ternatea TaxID=43366 RepID=A0AAN9K4F8_CLITE